MEENKLIRVVLIDADSLIYKVSFAKELKDIDDYSKFREMLDNWIIDIITTCDCTHYLGFLTIGKTFRHDLATNQEYKSGRPLDKPKFYHELLKHMINYWGFTYQSQLEAEDLVAIWSHEGRFIHSVIARIDHDLDQIPGKHYNYVTKEFKDISIQESMYNLYHQCITGCTTDKIQGIPGLGKVKASKILTEGEDTYPSLVLQSYTQYYGLLKGITLFAETFRLIFLLRTIEHVKHITGLDYILPEPIEYKKPVIGEIAPEPF